MGEKVKLSQYGFGDRAEGPRKQRLKDIDRDAVRVLGLDARDLSLEHFFKGL